MYSTIKLLYIFYVHLGIQNHMGTEQITSLKSNILGVQYCTMDYNDVNIEFICDTAKQC